MMKRIVSFFITTTILISLLTSCKKDYGDPPALPSAESMTIDFSNFEPGKKSDLPDYYAKGTETSSWEFAAGVALIWRAIIYTTLAVPVKTFQLAVNSDPEYINDKTWEWSYDATLTIDQISVTYKARLTGQIRSSDVLWKMYISKEGAGAFSEFVWFEGTSALDGSSGRWILNESFQNQVPVLQIDWTKSGNSVKTIKYTYIKTGNPFKDSYIEYGLTTNALNAYYTIHFYNPPYLQFYDLKVEWSTTGHNGRIQCEDHFGNTDWYCWDSNYHNISCP